MNLSDTLAFITSADSDDIRTIVRFAKDRQRALDLILTASLAVGDLVELQNLRPKYLDGARARIESKSDGKYLIRFEPGCDPRATRRFGSSARVKSTMIRKVGA